MRRIVLVLPNWVADPETEEDILRQSLPSLTRLVERGRPFKLAPDPRVETPEALVLGMPPGVSQLRQGPLTISALGADPPERSTHFHLSLLEHSDGILKTSDLQPTEEELAIIVETSKKLNTKLLTFVKGEKRDHGLVWEALGDLQTNPPGLVEGKPIRAALPEGDGEPMLRRYIDDSINLLSELELNARRAGENLPLLNLLWPWGHGVRTHVPNLALKRGMPCLVVSDSMRLQGLSRLAGYAHADRSKLRSGLNFNLEHLLKLLLAESCTIAYIPAIQQLRKEVLLEEAAWLTRRLNDEIFAPIEQRLETETLRLTLLAPSEGSMGLGCNIESNHFEDNAIPFDSRALEEKALSVATSWEAVAYGLA